MDLNNSGVWVTNDAQGLFGRVNRSAGALDAAFTDPNRESRDSHVDIFQDGEAVLGWTRDEGRLFPVDTRMATSAPGLPLGVGPLSAVAMAGGVMATISSDKGDVRLLRYTPTQIPDFTNLSAGVAANLEVVSGLQSGVDVAVDGEGRVFAASASGAWVLIDSQGQTTYGNAGQSLRSVAASLVGGVGVIADAVSGDVFLTTGIHVEVGAGVVPQQPGEDGSRVVVASPSGLVAIAVNNGTLTGIYDVPSSDSGATHVIAEPVVRGQTMYGAWGGMPGRVVKIDPAQTYADVFPQDGSRLSTPTFRVNRGSVVLNDMATGAVFDMDEKWSVDNWEDVAPEATELSGDSSSSSEDSPQAGDDHLWARPGRMAVLHVLDNDKNPGTGIVAITAISGPDASHVVISPDGQTLVADVATDQTEDMTLTYTITNRAVNSEETDLESSANVTISMRALPENNPPYQVGAQGRDETAPDFTVPSGGFLSLAPAGSWRDPDSDAVSVVSATVAGRVLAVTAQGLIQYHAGATPGQISERIDYVVSDGNEATSAGAIWVRVMPDSAVQAIPPIAMPDSVRGVVGGSMTLYPLDNDIPGSDPLDKQAQMKLASPVGSRVGIEVTTDLLSGEVTITSDHAGAYFLDYMTSFGSGFAAGKIRVDIVDNDSLVAMPDWAVIRGTVPVVVDVLDNDRDSLGSVLTVISATPSDERVRIGVIAGRWLRIDPVSAVVKSAPTIVTYQVTNGLTQATGQVSVVQVPAVDMGRVSIVDDTARVRAGDVTTIAVLDNDTSESGETLVLNDNVESMANAGQLLVEDPSAPNGQQTLDVGRAYVDGNRVRYEAPVNLDQPKRVRIEYQAGLASGAPMTGYVIVDVVPEPTAPGAINNVPTPQSLEARVIVGDAQSIPVPIYGQDPDGDSVTVAGLRTPPKYGRVVNFGADYLTYESYPDVGNTGMDSFQYYVQDRFGAMGIGTVRIGLSAPHDVPPPLGVDDVVTAQPNVSVTVYPTSNDVIPIGTGETAIILDNPSAAVVDQGSASVVTTVPSQDAPAVSLGYHLDAGGVAGTSAQIMVRSQVGYLNPPNVFDHAAEDVDSGVASVDVLDDAWDVDGADEDIHIVSVGSTATFDGAKVSVPILDRGQVVPFVVEDGDGAQAMAVVFVPSLTDGRPALVAGGLIRMDRNGTRDVNLNDFIESPRGEAVHLTLASQAWTSPTVDLDVSVNTDTQVTLRARNDYVGPAALTVEVRDSSDATDPAALTGVVTIPVQIGAATPVLWCPDDPVDVAQGGVAISIDVAEVCHAWMPTQVEIDALRYVGSWVLGGDGISVDGRDQGGFPSDVMVIQALPAARPGSESTLSITVDGYDVASQLRVRVIAAPPPTISVSDVADVQQGTQVSVPVRVTSPMVGGVQNIVRVIPVSGPSAAVSFDEQTIQVTPDQAGLLVFDVVGSDISDDSRTDRQVTGSFSVEAYGTPDPPSPPQPGTQLRSGSAVVTFAPGADNGAPILGYEVQWDGGSISCGLNTTCEIPRLTNGTAYRFQVRAINKAGESAWSEPGPEVIPNAIPAAVPDFTVSEPGCGSVVLTWGAPQGEGSAPIAYHLTWGGADPVTLGGTTTTYTPTGLDNTKPLTFTIVAENQAGMGQLPVAVQGQSSCKPVWLGSTVTATPDDMGDTAQVKVSWPEADAQGPDPVTYLLTRSGPDGTKQFAPTTETSLGDTGDEITYDGQTYTYSVTAVNATGGADHTSDPLTAAPYQAISAPAPWSSVGGADAVKIEATGVNGEVKISVVSFPKFHDSSGEVRVTIGTTALTLTPSNASRTLTGFTNGTDVEAAFTACNNQDLCNSAQRVSLAGGSFGDLTAPLISASKGDGRDVCVTASGSGNGRGATLVVTGSNGIGEVYRNTTLTAPETCVDALAWDTDITFTAHLETAVTTPTRENSPGATTVVRSSVGTPDPWDQGAIQVKGNGVDGQLVVTAPVPASNGGTLKVFYTVDSGAPQEAHVFTDTVSIVVDGLNNGQDYSIVLIADNGASTSTSTAVKGHPYGPLAAPILTPQPGQGMNACIQATTPESGTNGERAKLYLWVGTTGTDRLWESVWEARPIDSGVQCYPAGGYDTQVTFRASLATGSDLNRTDSPMTTAYATSGVGTPGALSSSNIVWAATGVDQQVRLELTGTLPDHNGGSSDHLRVDVTGVPGGTVSLTESAPIATVNGLTNGTPTTLTFTPCNASQCNDAGSVAATVTAAGGLTTPTVSSTRPPEGIVSPDKNVCAVFSASGNGAVATLTITNDKTSKTESAQGTGTIVKELCEDTGAANIPVTFTATLDDSASLNRVSRQVSVTVVSAANLAPMDVRVEGSAHSWNDLTVKMEARFRFDPHGGDALGTIRVVNPRSDETWDMAGMTNFSIPASGGAIVVTFSGTLPSDNRIVQFEAEIIDISGENRATQTDTQSLSPAEPLEVGYWASADPTPGGNPSTNKTVCSQFNGLAGALPATLTVSALGQSTQTTGTGRLILPFCVDAGGASVSVTFTGTVTDASGSGRDPETTTYVATSAADFPTCSYAINSPTNATITFANVLENSQAMFTSNLESRCAWPGNGTTCLTFSGSGTQVVDWPEGTDITSNFTLKIVAPDNTSVTCTKE